MESALEAGCYILNGYEHSELDRLVKCVFIVELKFQRTAALQKMKSSIADFLHLNSV